jgi:F-type H+-transporting ATPase subunit b
MISIRNPEFWYGAAFVLLILFALYKGVVGSVNRGLDERARRIAAELDEARRLREEAEAMVAEYEAKRKSADAEAAAIVAAAQAESQRAMEEANIRLTDFVARRTATAESKIAQAEVQAIAEVRAVAADTAVKAAAGILSAKATGEVAERLLDQGLQEVRSKLH